MLQRIQTVFLFFTALTMLAACLTPLAVFLLGADRVVVEVLNMQLNGRPDSSGLVLFVIGIAASLLAVITIFFYKNRKLQIRLSIFNIILMICFYLYFGFIVFGLSSNESFHFEKIGVGIIMPVIGIIFTILAIRKIKADEALVRSLNRLRR